MLPDILPLTCDFELGVGRLVRIGIKFIAGRAMVEARVTQLHVRENQLFGHNLLQNFSFLTIPSSITIRPFANI